jgi:hypothetical protein
MGSPTALKAVKVLAAMISPPSLLKLFVTGRVRCVNRGGQSLSRGAEEMVQLDLGPGLDCGRATAEASRPLAPSAPYVALAILRTFQGVWSMCIIDSCTRLDDFGHLSIVCPFLG